MTLRVVDTPLDPDRADVVVLRAPGKPRDTEHPALKPLNRGALDWFMIFRQNLRENMGEAEAAATATVQWRARRGHDGHGRRFQPAATR